jgi:hypothetical protein
MRFAAAARANSVVLAAAERCKVSLSYSHSFGSPLSLDDYGRRVQLSTHRESDDPDLGEGR